MKSKTGGWQWFYQVFFHIMLIRMIKTNQPLSQSTRSVIDRASWENLFRGSAINFGSPSGSEHSS